jgi:bacterioferritin-associated ferredoxin
VIQETGLHAPRAHVSDNHSHLGERRKYLMYICICNALTDKQVDRAIKDGCREPSDVYKACGTQPQCGRCMETMWHMLDTAMGEAAVSPGE